MEFNCKISNISRDLMTNKFTITLETEQNITSVEELKEQELTCRLVRFRKRRSLDANAYFWVLVNKLSNKAEIAVTEVYRAYIKEIGGNSTTICVQNKAVEQLCKSWQHNGIGWITETFDSKIPDCTNVILYYGSSTYNTEQMSRLIDMVVQDCKEQGIETLTPEQLAMMKAGWGE